MLGGPHITAGLAGSAMPKAGFSAGNWTSSTSSLRFEDAVVETVVTKTTRTTTSFAPLQLPRIPLPESLGTPSHLPSEQYPLAHVPTPDDMKWFAMRVGNQRVIITEDGAVDPESSPDAGWRRTLPTLEASGAVADHRIGLIEAMDRLKGKKVRKRSHDNDGDILHTNQLTPAASRNDHGYEVDAYPSPPRKRIRRPEEIATPIGGSGAPLSPLPSPEPEGPAPLSPASPTDEPSTLRSPAMGTGHEFAALYSLPSIVSQFDGFPDKLQQHVLMHLLRRSRIPTIQRVAGFANGALRRDFISSLPRELAVQILQSVDAKTLAQATRVSRKWRSVIDSERVVWKQRLIDEGLYQGHGREEEDEATIARRLKLLRDHKRSGSLAGHEDTESDESMANIPSMSDDESPVPLKHVYRRRYQSNENWFTKRPAHNSFPGHGTNVVTCLQFDRDKIVSASDDHSINVYSTVDGKLRKKLVGHDGGVWALQYRGHALVTGSTDRSLRVWDLDTLRLTHVFAGHTSTVRCLQIVEPVLDPKTGAYYPPYPVIVTGSRDHTLRVWKLPRKGQPNFTYHDKTEKGEWIELPCAPSDNPYHMHLLTGHSDAIRALDAYGRTCVSGSYDTTVRVWDLVKGTCLHVLRGHDQKVYSVVYDRHRHQCASGSMDNTVKIWDLETGDCLHTLTGHTSLVGLLGLSPNYLVSAAADSSLRIWNADNTVELKQVLRNNGGAITCFQHDESKVVSGSDGMLKLWDIRKGRSVRDLAIGLSSVWQVGFNDNLLVAASNRSGTTVFDVFDFGELNHISGVDNDKLDELVRPSWDKRVYNPTPREYPRVRPHLRLEHAYDDADDQDELASDFGFEHEAEDSSENEVEIDWDNAVTSSPLFRLDKSTNTYHQIETHRTQTTQTARRSERLASKSTGVDSPIRVSLPGSSRKGKSATSTPAKIAGPSTLPQSLPKSARRANEPPHPPSASKRSLLHDTIAMLEKGKGKAKAESGRRAVAGPSGSGGGSESHKAIVTRASRVNRSRSGPGNSISPLRYTRTSSHGHLSTSTVGGSNQFASVFDDEDDEDGPAVPRSRPRRLSEEDELNSIARSGEDDADGEEEDEEEEEQMENDGDREDEENADQAMSDGID